MVNAMIESALTTVAPAVAAAAASVVGNPANPDAAMDALAQEIKQAETPATRDVVIKVPVSVSDNQVNNAIRLGILASNVVQSGMMFLAWPALVKTPQGQEAAVIQQTIMPIFDKKDVDRVLQLVKVIGETNVAAAKNGADALSTSIAGGKVKDNAARDLTGQAEGNSGGIIIP